MEDLKAIDYRKGMTHKDVREAINANTERANANFAEMGNGGLRQYIAILEVEKGENNENFTVHLDKELGPRDSIQLFRISKTQGWIRNNRTSRKKWRLQVYTGNSNDNTQQRQDFLKEAFFNNFVGGG